MGIFKDRRLAKAATQAATANFGVMNADEGTQYGAPVDSDLAQNQAALNVHLGRLKELKTMEAKADYKRSALLDIMPFVVDYGNKGHNYPNNVAVYAMVWLIDTGDIEAGLHLGLLLDTQAQRMPPGFSSDIATFLVDYVCDFAIQKLKAEQSAEPYLSQLIQAYEQRKWQINNVVAGKLYAMAAKHAAAANDPENTVVYGEQALHINERAGVKKLVQDARAALDI